jgi:hypothetical protein
MDDFDLVLRDRLVRLEGSLVLPAPHRSAWPRVSRALIAALLAAGVIAGGAGAAALIRGQQAKGSEGLFNPGQPLACSRVWLMTPPDAARYLAARGYDVTWQVEDTDKPKGHPSKSYQTKVAPPTGFVIEGVREGNRLTMVVEVGSQARQATPPEC